MNYNVRAIIRSYAPDMSDRDIYHKLTREEMEMVGKRKAELKTRNAKYNNKNHG